MLSPFRYPGGKSRLAPAVVGVAKRLLGDRPGSFLLEPFAGGASVSLAAASAGIPARLVELDARVAAFWDVALGPKRGELCQAVLNCDPQAVWEEHVRGDAGDDPVTQALAALVQNRLAFGGNMTARPGAIVVGDRGRGALSRWYPTTLVKRIQALGGLNLSTRQGCAYEALAGAAGQDAFAFIDPPYLRAGRRLYAHNAIDLERLLAMAAKLPYPWLLTYENTQEAREAMVRHGVAFLPVGLLGNSNQVRTELIAGPWLALCLLTEELHHLTKRGTRHVVA